MSDRAPAVPLIAATFLCAALAACGAPPEAERDLPPVQSGAAPDLVPTASFDAPRAEAATRQAGLGAEASDLAARAASLETRAAALGTPVLTDSERDRLAAAP